MSTSIGNLFINVKATTGQFTKSLGNIRRRLRTFATSGMGMIAGIAAGFGAWKIGSTIFGQLLAHNKEFRESWAKVQNTVMDLIANLANKFGPAFADGLNALAEWLETSTFIESVFDGISTALEYIGPLLKDMLDGLVTAQDKLAEFFNWATGTTAQAEENAKGISIDELRQLQAAADNRQLEKIARNTAVTARAGVIE